MTLGDLVVANNDVGNDAQGPEQDRGRQHDRGAQHDVSDHRASVMFNAGQNARGWILAAATADVAGNRDRVQKTLTTP